MSEILTLSIVGGAIYDTLKFGLSTSLDIVKVALKDTLLSDEEKRLISLDLDNASEKNKFSKEKLVNYFENEAVEAKTIMTNYQNVSIFNNTTNVINLGKDNNSIIKNQKKILTNFIINDIFIGREREINEIHQRLNDKESLLLINGIGGVGKTTLAAEYGKRYLSFYNKIAFVEYSNSIEESFLNAFFGLEEANLNRSDEKFNKLLLELSIIPKMNLLVIDNLLDSFELSKIKNKLNNFHIIITSRKVLNIKTVLNICNLSLNHARELFNVYYSTKEDIDNILEYLDYHTTFIELTAKTLNKSNLLTIKILEEKFKSGELPNIKYKKNNKYFNDYLKELFNLDTLSDGEKLTLRKISLFPSIEISFEKLKEFLCIEDDEKFDEELICLADAGWISENSGSYKLHQIIREYLHKNERISFSESSDIVEFFNSATYINPTENPLDKFELLIFNEEILKVLDENHPSLASNYNNISMIYKDLGDL
ncbi:NB-ARC domain-containing protein, partial [Poseidonibacter lekithochrous]|uniref:NB-ARC domain-containing protein n=1 Tax=Poseidonibacter lekithochrous TaxID=1904463 RepID=UPI0013DB993F